MRRKVAVGALLAMFCLGVVLTRVIWDGRAALAAGDAAWRREDRHEAIARWRRAARWYAPGAPHVAAAYARLEDVARQADAAGDAALALAAWTAIRSSILATRSFYTPFADKLPACDERIAALMAAGEDPAVDPGKSAAERAAWHRALLEKSEREAPSVAWSLVALLGFAGWVGGGFLFAWRGVTAEDRLDKKAAARAGLLVLVGLLVWMLGLYRA